MPRVVALGSAVGELVHYCVAVVVVAVAVAVVVVVVAAAAAAAVAAAAVAVVVDAVVVGLLQQLPKRPSGVGMTAGAGAEKLLRQLPTLSGDLRPFARCWMTQSLLMRAEQQQQRPPLLQLLR